MVLYCRRAVYDWFSCYVQHLAPLLCTTSRAIAMYNVSFSISLVHTQYSTCVRKTRILFLRKAWLTKVERKKTLLLLHTNTVSRTTDSHELTADSIILEDISLTPPVHLLEDDNMPLTAYHNRL